MRKRIIGLILINALFITIMAILRPAFISVANVRILLSGWSLESIIMVGMTMLLVAQLFDLSTDGVVAVSGVVAGLLMKQYGATPVEAIAAALAIGMLVGLINGLLVMYVGINPLIVTLGMWWVMIGAAYGLTKSISPYGFSESFQQIGQARILGLRIFVWYAVVIVGALWVVLSKTRMGRHIYIMGGNSEAGRLFGVQTKRLGVGLFVLMGLLSAFVGVVFAARLNAGTPNAVDGMAMRVVAAAVIGGCAMKGGRGSIVAGLFGLMLLGMLGNACILLGISPYWQKSLMGLVLLTALMIDAVSGKVNFKELIHLKRRDTDG